MSTSYSDSPCADNEHISECDHPDDELQNGIVNGIADHPQDRIPTPETSHQLILEKIQKLNLENHELKLASVELKSKITQLEQSCQSLKTKADRANSQVESTKNELQSMVIKYATSEKEVLNLKKHYGDSDRKLKELVKERDSWQAKIKELTEEKKVLLSNVERHILETATLQNDNEILKNKLEQTDVKIQQLQLSLNEVQSKYRISRRKLERIENGLNQLNCPSKVHKCEFEENSSDDVEPSEVTEKVQKSHDESTDSIDWTEQYLSCIEANKRLNREVKQLEVEREQYKSKIEELNQRLNDANEHVKDYMHKVDLIDSLKNEMINKQKAIEDLKKKFDKINDINRELVSDIESSKLKEGELLEYTERMTAKMVTLQSEHNSLTEKLNIAEEECERQKKNFKRVSSEKDILASEYESHNQICENHVHRLKSELNEKILECDGLKKKVEELDNEIKILNRKLFLNFKELNKEIRTLKQQNENLLERAGPQGGLTVQNNNVETTSTLSSRTNSLNSLSENDSEKKPDGHSLRQHSDSTQHSSSETSSSDYELITSLNDIDKNVLIDRILRLQRTLIKRNEKIDFLEEHNQHLMEEVKKKCKLLQYYILKEETGALATESMDKNKVYLSKRGGGIMSSLYNSSLTDDTMTLERSLEINNKLHAVLEDTLLKNMTLKENLNTLAMEIDRLSKQKM